MRQSSNKKPILIIPKDKIKPVMKPALPMMVAASKFEIFYESSELDDNDE